MNTISAHDSGSQVLLIGLDSADAELIDQWCRAGHLPNIERLRNQGVWGNLGTTAEVMHVSAWPSIYTGTHPGKHGMYHAYQITAGEQNVHRTLAEPRQAQRERSNCRGQNKDATFFGHFSLPACRRRQPQCSGSDHCWYCRCCRNERNDP